MSVAAVCVPVRNEQALLPAFLDSCGALDTANMQITLCLFLDGCRDRSAAIVEDFAEQLPFALSVEHGPGSPTPNAGRARRSAMRLGLAALGAASDGILLSTDADSEPQPDWVQAALNALDLADIAAGRIVRVEVMPDLNQARVEQYYDRLHAHRRAIDPTPWDHGGCHFAGGANMAMRADAYRALGGFRPLPSGEDAGFLDDAARAGYRVRHDPAMIVRTSSRRDGRAPGGLAGALADLDAHGLPLVGHPAAADWQYRAQAAARATFGRLGHEPSRARLGAMIGLTADHVLGVGRDCPNAEAFCMRIVPAPAGGEKLVPLAEAEEALTRLERDRCSQAA